VRTLAPRVKLYLQPQLQSSRYALCGAICDGRASTARQNLYAAVTPEILGLIVWASHM
jgi:hypothetical protein